MSVRHYKKIMKRPKSRIYKLTILFILFCVPFSFAAEENYTVAVLPCPVLNTEDFEAVFGGKDGKTVRLDNKGLIREMEFIALPGTSFEIISRTEKGAHSILRVTTREYPSQTPLFIDSRFAAFKKEEPPGLTRPLWAVDSIITNLKSMEGSPYMWGGNYYQGIEQMTRFYPPSGDISAATLALWRLEGVDCSGLIYQASGGQTPRNTRSMLHYGEGLKISGLSAEKIAGKVMPLDLIVWPGHVVVVLDAGMTIESRHSRGVVRTPLVSRLRSIMAERIPADNWEPESGNAFVIRRWHESFLR